MAGGLLNLVSYGQENVIIYGNPKKTYFITKFKTITNFGIQNFRIDFDGQRNLRLDTDSVMEFKIPRYADLLGNTFVVINIPNIWSPIEYDVSNDEWNGYEFKWIEQLGNNLLKEIEITIGGQIVGKYSGEYFANVVDRDIVKGKTLLYNLMTGNTKDLNDPANAYDRINVYPHAYNPNITPPNIRPSIMGKKLYIPLECWFSTTPSYALPLIALQYQEVRIKITFRAISELYTIRDVTDISNSYPYIAPNMTIAKHQLYNFLSPPLDTSNNVMYTSNVWDADIHLMSKYYFLDTIEREYFAKKNHKYLIKDVYETDYLNISGKNMIELESRGIVSNYMFRFRRSDAFMRNTWSNYTNWPYETIPYTLSNMPSQSPISYIFTTGFYDGNSTTLNTKNILLDMGILLEGKYRENVLDAGIYNYIDKYLYTNNCVKDGLYIYSFELNDDLKNHQPSGGMSMDKFDVIQLELNTILPPQNPNSTYTPLCDAFGNEIGTRKNLWQLNEYNFDLRVFEERYNILEIQAGMGGLHFAR